MDARARARAQRWGQRIPVGQAMVGQGASPTTGRQSLAPRVSARTGLAVGMLLRVGAYPGRHWPSGLTHGLAPTARRGQVVSTPCVVDPAAPGLAGLAKPASADAEVAWPCVRGASNVGDRCGGVGAR